MPCGYDKDLVSIVVPVYNGEEYLERCITSLQQQSYPYLEIILVDDGSQDDSLKICQKEAEKDPRIQVIHKENGGVASARNAGMAAMTGQWLLLIDGDDYIHPDMVRDLLAAVKEGDAQVAVCGFERVYADGTPPERHALGCERSSMDILSLDGQKEERLGAGEWQTRGLWAKKKGTRKRQAKELWIRKQQMRGLRGEEADRVRWGRTGEGRLLWSGSLSAFVADLLLPLYRNLMLRTQSNKLYSVPVIRENGLWYPEGISINEDIWFCARYLTYCRRVACIPGSYLYYWQKAQGASQISRYHPEGVESCFLLLEAVEGLLKAADAPDEVRRAMDDEMLFHICGFAGHSYSRTAKTAEECYEEIVELAGRSQFKALLERMEPSGLKNKVAAFLLGHGLCRLYHWLCLGLYGRQRQAFLSQQAEREGRAGRREHEGQMTGRREHEGQMTGRREYEGLMAGIGEKICMKKKADREGKAGDGKRTKCQEKRGNVEKADMDKRADIKENAGLKGCRIRQEIPDRRGRALGQSKKAPGQREKAPKQREQAPEQKEKAPGQREQAPEQREQAPGQREMASGQTERERPVGAPLVSISCVSFNHEAYIARALDSFLMQETDFPFEILVYDDASTDRTQAIIRDYEEKYPDLIKPYYQTENQYSQGKYNVEGYFNYPRAKGKYIAMCDGDDYWTDKKKLQLQVDYMEAHPGCSMCFHAARIETPERSIQSLKIRPYRGDRVIAPEKVIDKPSNYPTASLLFRTAYTRDLQDYYYVSPVGDISIQIHLAAKGWAYYMDREMSAYRQGVSVSWSTQMKQGDLKKNLIDHHNAMKVMYRGFSKETGGQYDQAIERACRRMDFLTLVNTKSYREALLPGYRPFFKELPLRTRLFIWFELLAPGPYRRLRRLVYGEERS